MPVLDIFQCKQCSHILRCTKHNVFINYGDNVFINYEAGFHYIQTKRKKLKK